MHKIFVWVLAHLGRSGAQLELGRYYIGKANGIKARKWLNLAAGNNEVQAITGLGYCDYIEGNVLDAICNYQKSAEKGDAEALYHLGLIYFSGEGVQTSDERAFSYYQQSADRGYPDAIHMLAWCYQQGVGVEPDNEKALSLWMEAAKYNVPESLCAIGSYYLKGDLAPQSNQEAYKWFYLAMENGDEDAPKEIEALSLKMTSSEIVNATNAAEEWNIEHS